MRIVFTRDSWRDYRAWADADRKTFDRINALIEEVLRDPVQGAGKPEPLKRDLSGLWSRRIRGAHRLVYRVRGEGAAQALEVLSCRYHYCGKRPHSYPESILHIAYEPLYLRE